jgi:hypothetical protein
MKLTLVSSPQPDDDNADVSPSVDRVGQRGQLYAGSDIRPQDIEVPRRVFEELQAGGFLEGTGIDSAEAFKEFVREQYRSVGASDDD